MTSINTSEETAMPRKPDRKYEQRTITKEDATRWLAKVSHQRELDDNWTAGLTRLMDLGQFDCGGGRTPIAFDYDGNLINGRHRLTAFLASKLPDLTFIVVTGCPPSDVKGFDIDIKTRGMKQVHAGIGFAHREMARVAALDRLITARTTLRNPQGVLDYLFRHTYRKEAKWAGELMPNAGGEQRAAFAAALMYVHRADPPFADKIGRAWVNGGAGLPQTMIRFRDEALRGSSAREIRATRGGRFRAVAIDTSFKMLNVLAFLHQKKEVPRRLSTGKAGLRYFSGLLRDGAAKRWGSDEPLPLKK